MNAYARQQLARMRAERARETAKSTGPKEHTERGRPVVFAELAAFAKRSCKFCGGAGQYVRRMPPVREHKEQITDKDGKVHTRTVRTSMPIELTRTVPVKDGERTHWTVEPLEPTRAAKACGCAINRFLKVNGKQTILGGDEQIFWRKGLEPALPPGVELPTAPVEVAEP